MILEILPNLSNEDYHSREEYSSSFLKSVYKHSVAKALAPKDEFNPAFQFGTWFHDMMELGVEGFNTKYVVFRDADIIEQVIAIRKRKGVETKKAQMTKEYKSFLGRMQSEAQGKELVSGEEYDKILQMYENVQKLPLIKQWNDTYRSFEEYSFLISSDGLRYRVRPDRIYSDSDPTCEDAGRILVDWKTCQDVTQFRYDAKKYAYDLQAVFYADLLNVPADKFYFVAVEKEYPFTAQIFGLSDKAIGEGRTKMGIALDKIISGDCGFENIELL